MNNPKWNSYKSYIVYKKIIAFFLSCSFFYCHVASSQSLPIQSVTPEQQIDHTQTIETPSQPLPSTAHLTSAEPSKESFSQASSHNFGINEEVNKNTGDFSLKYPLINSSIKGVNSGVELTLTYNSASSFTDSAGYLPIGWSFDLPYIDINQSNQTVHFNGISAIADNNYSDTTGYKSGLRYVNNHGLKFQKYLNIQQITLPSNQVIFYSFSLKANDGSLVFFDSYGKPTAKKDRFNNFVTFSYYDSSTYHFSRIKEIRGNYSNQVINFSYDSTGILLTYPNGAKTKLWYSNGNLVRIDSPLSESLNLEYNSTLNANLVTKVLSPSGLETDIEYNSKISANNCSQIVTKYAVSKISHLDLSNQAKLLDSTQYFYGRITGQYYSGYPKVQACNSSITDPLMESNLTKFIYDVDEIKSAEINTVDESGKAITKLTVTTNRTYYNNLHLPVETDLFTSDLPVNNPYSKTLYTYNLTNDIKKMNPSYTMPTSTSTSVYDVQTATYKPSSYEENTYDSYNNKLSHIRFEYNFTNLSWTPVEKNTYTYYHDDSQNDFSLLQKEDTTDILSNTTIETQYTLSPDKKLIQTKTVGNLKGVYEFNPYLEETTKVDEFGRKISEVTTCLDSSSNFCANGISSKSNYYSYVYNNDNSTLTFTETDSLGNKYTTIIDANIDKPIEKILPSGKVTAKNQYDIIGRETNSSTLNFDGSYNEIKTSYDSYQASKRNLVVKTNSRTNYSLTTYYDALGRETEKYDNFSPQKNTIDNSISRFMSAKEYNDYGNIKYEENMFHQKNLHLYDTNNREIGLLDSSGNVYYSIINDYLHTKTNYINNILASNEKSDSLGNVIESNKYPNTKYNCSLDPLLSELCSKLGNAQNNNLTIQELKKYDAFGKMTESKTIVKSDQVAPEVLLTTAYEYDNFGNQIKSTSTGYDGTIVTLNSQYDALLSKIIEFSKQKIDYNKTILPKYVSDKSYFDALGRITKVVRQDGAQELYTYDQDGNLVKKVTFGGITHNYTYYQNSLLKSDKIDLPISMHYSNAYNFIKNKVNVVTAFLNSMRNSDAMTISHTAKSIFLSDSIWQNSFSNFNNNNQINYSYNYENSLTSVSFSENDKIDPSSIIEMNYLTDNKTISSYTYGNSSKISYNYDDYSRVINEIDVRNNITDYFYETNNPAHTDRILSIKNRQTGDSEDYNYYSDNEANENGLFGTLKSTSIKTNNLSVVKTKYSLTDPMHRTALTVELDSKNAIIQETTYSFDKYLHTAQVQYSSTLYPEDKANYTLKYSYDSSKNLVAFTKYYDISNTSRQVSNYKEEYVYDSNFNVLNKKTYLNDSLKKSTDYIYNNVSQLVSYTTNSSSTVYNILYDTEGNMIKDDLGNCYVYDHFFNKITQITNSSSEVQAQYIYYPNGNRSAKLTNTLKSTTNYPTQFFYNKSNVVMNESQNNPENGNTTFTSYLFSENTPKARFLESLNTSTGSKSLSSIYYSNSDKLINKTLENAETGLLVRQNFEYSPYGDRVNLEGESLLPAKEGYSIQESPYGYEFQNITDNESGLILLGARYYNPRLMRFMSLDTYSVDNKYAYGNGNPISNADPSGHVSVGTVIGDIFIGLGIILSAAITVGGALLAQPEVVASGVFGIISGGLSIAANHTTGKAKQALFWSALGAGIISLACAGGVVALFKSGQNAIRELQNFEIATQSSQTQMGIAGILNSGATGAAEAGAAEAGAAVGPRITESWKIGDVTYNSFGEFQTAFAAQIGIAQHVRAVTTADLVLPDALSVAKSLQEGEFKMALESIDTTFELTRATSTAEAQLKISATATFSKPEELNIFARIMPGFRVPGRTLEHVTLGGAEHYPYRPGRGAPDWGRIFYLGEVQGPWDYR